MQIISFNFEIIILSSLHSAKSIVFLHADRSRVRHDHFVHDRYIAHLKWESKPL